MTTTEPTPTTRRPGHHLRRLVTLMVSAVTAVSAVGYVVFDPTPSLALTASVTTSAGPVTVVYGTVSAVSGGPLAASVTVTCENGPARTQTRCTGGTVATATAGTWRIELHGCGSAGRGPAGCTARVTVRVPHPTVTGSKTLNLRAGTATRIDAHLKPARPWLLSWIPGGSY